MGFLWAWIYCSWFTPAMFPDSSGIGINANYSWFISCIAVAVTLIVSPLIWRTSSFHKKKWMWPVLLIFQSVGTIFMADGSITMIHSDLLHVVGSITTGIGCGWLWIMWGELYVTFDAERIEAITPASAVIIPLCLLLVTNIVGIAAVVVIALLPVISGLLLALAFEGNSNEGQPQASPERPRTKRASGSYTWSSFLRIGLGSLVIYMTLAFIWSMVTTSDLEMLGQGLQGPFIIGAVFAILLSIYSVLFSRSLNLFAIYRWMLPAIVIAIAFFSLEQDYFKAVSYILITIIQLGFDIMIWMYYAQVAKQPWQTPAICLGMSRGFVQIGVVLGNLSGLLAINAISSGPFELYHFCLFFICLCVAIVSLVVSWEQGWEKTKYPTLSDELSDEPNVGQATMQNSYHAIGAEAGLSEREQEVFDLLARGRSLPYIRDELYISKNTVETHVKKIYKKLDVHSKQELIDFVEKYRNS